MTGGDVTAPRQEEAAAPTPAGRDAGWWGRWVALAGGVWGALASAYLFASSVDKHVISVLHNASARHPTMGYSLLGFAVAVAGMVVALALRGRPAGWLLGLLALVFATAVGAAVDESDQPDRLTATLALVVAPAGMLALGGLLWSAAEPRRWRAVGGYVVAMLLAESALAATWQEDPLEQTRLFAGLAPGWEVEDGVENVFVDEAGRVWGVRPWREAAPTGLYLLGDDGFELVRSGEVGWPPAVIGSDAGGTWLVSSDARDPFEPVVEVYRSGGISRVAAPESPLPPLDAVALDPLQGVLYGLHSDFSLPARAVLEVFDGEAWSTVATPIEHSGRLSLVDAAVGRAGELWVWHDGDPDLLHRYDGEAWTTHPVPFDVAPSVEVAPLETSLDPFRTFVRGPEGSLWLHDGDAGRLVGLGPGGELEPERPVPPDAVPLVVDGDGVAWCRIPAGLLLVDARGEVVYDSTSEGMPEMEVESVAVAATSAWVRAGLGEGHVLLRFDRG